jgi:hypothetical protein
MAGGGPSKKTKTRTGAPTGRPEKDPCDISLTTPLAHVRTAHTARLRPGALLKVDVETVIKRKTVVCRIRETGEVAGYVLSRGAAGLIDCIDQGNEYVAEVKKIDFGFLEVTVRRSA